MMNYTNQGVGYLDGYAGGFHPQGVMSQMSMLTRASAPSYGQSGLGVTDAGLEADFCGLLAPIFQRANLKEFKMALAQSLQRFERSMQSHNSLAMTSTVCSLTYSTNKQSGQIFPPGIRVDPLAAYCNDVLSTFYKLHPCAPVSLACDIGDGRLNVLLQNSGIPLASYRAEEATFQFCQVYATNLLRYLNKCLQLLIPPATLAQILCVTLTDLDKMKQEQNRQALIVDIGSSWDFILKGEFSEPYFQELANYIAEERSKGAIYPLTHQVFPPAHQVFSWTQFCTPESVKVVILGQDPYHEPNQAHGLCFSVQTGAKIPPSLENIYKELKNDIEGFQHPGHGCLIGWAAQGVLLLNSCLTVGHGQANSHRNRGWEKFTDAVISWLNKNRTGLVFILWGSYAQKKGLCIDKMKHCVLQGVHPSPLSAYRGFYGCNHFSMCNAVLEANGKTPIDWTWLPQQY
ncbi:uncharacterized protein LOC110452944 [Mizuhopecten yessoensis]|uniref:Uracil-DNA glycosylase n=1 Tax=Mizuhopecten yessoensis TaxID=6573 RepID=A0A210QIM7_MIZYE|nr:uncharacterized protein LOC110452944 [Mizuhopecten yessoensis]OWF48536.1 Uracil-DNA glycosylase [Mizuhopecten yessoensis]